MNARGANTRNMFAKAAVVMTAITLLSMLLPLPALAAGGTVTAGGKSIVIDPNADSTAAIQALVNRATGTKTITFSAGEYRFSTVTLGSDTSVVLDPGAVVRPPVSATSTDGFFRVYGSSTAHKANVSITGGVFYGENKARAAVETNWTDNVTVRGVTAYDVTNGAVCLNDSDGATIDGNTLVGNRYGIAVLGTKNATITNNVTQRSGREGVLVYNRSDNVTVSGNTCSTYAQSGDEGRAGIQGYGSTRVYVLNNTLYDGGVGAGIRFRDSQTWQAVGNYVDNGGGVGIDVVRIGDFSGINGGDGTIQRNTILNSRQHGIAASNTAITPAVRVLDNTIKNVRATSTTVPGMGIYLRVPYSQAVGNYIENTSGDGIAIGGHHVTVSTNTVKNAAYSNVGPRTGVFVTGTNQSVRDNVISDARSPHKMVYGVRTISGSSALVSGNRVSGWVTSAYLLQGTKLSAVYSDTTKPTTSATTFASSTGLTAQVVGTDSSTGAVAVAWSVDGSKERREPGRAYNLRLRTRGSHVIRYRSMDKAGNWGPLVSQILVVR